MASQEILREEPSRGSFINDPKIRSLFFQTLVIILVFGSIYWIILN
ncbi:MAG: amino acid ABC transporter permease, partial [Mesorhizobium sp.]